MIGSLRRPVVLVYHAVDDVPRKHDPRRLVTPPRHLEAHIRMLRRLGYRFVTAEELLVDGHVLPPPERTAVLTFDDGWADWLSVALPLLQRLEVRATFYVCPGWFGTESDLIGRGAGRLLDEEGVGALHEAGMELGAHSVSHPDLRKLEDSALAEEIGGSKAAVERITGQPCRTFAYPYGLYDERVERAAGTAGFELAFTWQPGPWRALATPRLPVAARHGATRLALSMLGVRRRWVQPPP